MTAQLQFRDAFWVSRVYWGSELEEQVPPGLGG